MATFAGTDGSELITPTTVSPTVTTSGPPFPGAENDIIDAGGGSDVVAGMWPGIDPQRRVP